MTHKLTFGANISDTGSLIFDDVDLFKKCLKANAGKSIQIVLQKPSEDKTLPQLAYLFGVVIPKFAEYTGYSEEEAYQELKNMFLVRNAGTDREYIESLAALNKDEVTQFISNCVKFTKSLATLTLGDKNEF